MNKKRYELNNNWYYVAFVLLNAINHNNIKSIELLLYRIFYKK